MLLDKPSIGLYCLVCVHYFFRYFSLHLLKSCFVDFPDCFRCLSQHISFFWADFCKMCIIFSLLLWLSFVQNDYSKKWLNHANRSVFILCLVFFCFVYWTFCLFILQKREFHILRAKRERKVFRLMVIISESWILCVRSVNNYK